MSTVTPYIPCHDDRAVNGVNPLAPAAVIAEQLRRPIARDSLRVEYAKLMERIAENSPHTILGLADNADLDERADHLHRLLADVEKYVLALLKDCQSSSNTRIDCSTSVTGCISDLSGDVCGALLNAAADLRGEPW